MATLLSDPILRRRATRCVLPGIIVNGLVYFRRTDLDAWRAKQLGARTSRVRDSEAND
jgi:hypothetical protein